MDIRIDEQLWATSMAPEGVLQKWRVADGADVPKGHAVAEVYIEDRVHDIIASASGRLTHIVAEGDLIEPGTVIARVAE